MTLPSRHSIRNSSTDGLRRPSSRQYWISARLLFHWYLNVRSQTMGPHQQLVLPRRCCLLADVIYLYRAHLVTPHDTVNAPNSLIVGLMLAHADSMLLNQCWFIDGTPSTTTAQHRPNIGSMHRVCWVGECSYKCPPRQTRQCRCRCLYRDIHETAKRKLNCWILC